MSDFPFQRVVGPISIFQEPSTTERLIKLFSAPAISVIFMLQTELLSLIPRLSLECNSVHVFDTIGVIIRILYGYQSSLVTQHFPDLSLSVLVNVPAFPGFFLIAANPISLLICRSYLEELIFRYFLIDNATLYA